MTIIVVTDINTMCSPCVDGEKEKYYSDGRQKGQRAVSAIKGEVQIGQVSAHVMLINNICDDVVPVDDHCDS